MSPSFKPHVDDLPVVSDRASFEMGDRAPARAFDHAAVPPSIGSEHLVDGISVFGPIGSDVPEATGKQGTVHGVHDRRLDQAAFVVSSLRPRVGEEGPKPSGSARKAWQQVHGIGFHHDHVVNLTGAAAIHEVPHARCVDINGNDRLIGEASGQLDDRLSRAEPNVDNHGAVGGPSCCEVIGSDQRVGPIVQRASLARCDAAAPGFEGAQARTQDGGGWRQVHSASVWPIVAGCRCCTYGDDVRGGVVVVLVAGVLLAACAPSTMEQDAATACGWDEPSEPIVSAIDASPEQLSRNAARAQVRLAAAKQVAQADDRFAPLLEALQETSDFADELSGLSREQIAAIENQRWDFAKYTQAVARDQCEQLAAVVGRE